MHKQMENFGLFCFIDVHQNLCTFIVNSEVICPWKMTKEDLMSQTKTHLRALYNQIDKEKGKRQALESELASIISRQW